MVVFAMMLAVALGSPDPDGVVTTAPAIAVDLTATTRPVAPSTAGAAQAAVPHGLSTEAQIDRWIESRANAEPSWSEAGPRPWDDRRMHGQVSFGVGTGGLRDYGVAVSLPLGESGRLDITYRQVENGYGYGGYGYGYGLGPEPVFLDGRGYGFSDSRSGLTAFEARSARWRHAPANEPDRSDSD